MSKKFFYVTTPIYYVNDKPHIGSAYTTMACDALARFKRLDGYEVMFLTGTDEHGQKILQAAEKKGKTPQELTDEVSENFREMSRVMNFSNDKFIRTTESHHKKAAQAIWQKMVEAGDIYLDKYAGWYSVRDEAFFTEAEITTNEEGVKIAPTGTPVDWVEEESYFFRLSNWADKLIAYYEAHPEAIQPKSRYNEVMSFIKGGLRDLSISRTTFDWGVKVPGDEKHVMYVWVDALTNYISALGYPDTDGEDFKNFWPADVHIVGKDILRFHAVYWPAFLMSAGLAPPKKVYAHGWWTIEGEKMSKSLGNVISPQELVDGYGLDQTRYFLLREIPFGNDGNFSRQQMTARINAELANTIGNLVQRTLSMIQKNCEAQVPAAQDLQNVDKELLDKSGVVLLDLMREKFDTLKFQHAFEDVLSLAMAANHYIDEQAPWTLKKTDVERMGTVLYVLAEVIRNIGLMLQPIMPDSSAKILDQVAVPEDQRAFKNVGADYALKPGTPLPKPEGVFPRILEEDAA